MPDGFFFVRREGCTPDASFFVRGETLYQTPAIV